MQEIESLFFGLPSTAHNFLCTFFYTGIKLILDFVPNHSSCEHEWFQKSLMNDSTYRDYYVWANARVNNDTFERLPPNNWVTFLVVFRAP
jgi:alpha-glucosidase